MKTSKSLLFLLGLCIFGALIFSLHNQSTPTTSGAFNPTGGGTYRLQTSLGTTDTSIKLSSFKEPVSNIAYTMTYLNTSIGYATLDPQNTSRKEFVSFSGITQNSDGTATLTGVTRGLGFSYPFTASSTLRQAHPGQSIFILSDSPQLFSEYLVLRNTATSTGVLVFSSTTPPQYDASYTASGNQLVSAAQLNATAFAGAPTSTEAIMGLSQLANQTQIGSSTASSTTGAPLVIPNIYATTTPGTQCTSNVFHCIVSTNLGKIAMSFINQAVAWAFTNTVSIPASVSFPFTLNSVAYVFPTAQGAASTTIFNNGSGTLSWGGTSYFAVSSSSYPTWSGSSSTTTVASYTIPANTLVNGARVRATVYFSSFNVNSNNMLFSAALGGQGTSTLTTGTTGNILSAFSPMVWTVDLVALGGSSQVLLNTMQGATSTLISGQPAYSIAVDPTVAQSFILYAGKPSTATLQPVFSTIEVLR